MINILSTGLAAMLLVACAEPVSAQVVQSRRMESETTPEPRITDTSPVVATTTDSTYYETRPEGDPIVRETDLFTMEFSTGIVFRATCQHIERFDPCLQFPTLLGNLGEASDLTVRAKELMREMLDNREIIERLEQLTVEKIRREARAQSGISRKFPFKFVVGAVLFTGGGFVSVSNNEWTPDEGYIGVTAATVGLGLMLKPLIDRWRGGSRRLNVSHNGLALAW